MKGDFTRDTFDPARNYSRVLMQQGRVSLDADWNEQSDILLHYIRGLAADMLGPHGGFDPAAFAVLIPNNSSTLKPADVKVGVGRYYVQGLPVENLDEAASLDPLFLPDSGLPDAPFLVYLDVWERHITPIEQADIAEIALGGPDTATRPQVVWQVKSVAAPTGTIPVNGKETPVNKDTLKADSGVLLAVLQRAALSAPGSGLLRARAGGEPDSEDDCTVSPEAQYRGAENQLYRVEIHRPGVVGNNPDTGATFKWSRENGSVTFPILDVSGKELTLPHIGRDGHLGLQPGDWVELVDDAYVLGNLAQELFRVEKAVPTGEVTLNRAPSFGDPTKSTSRLLRRWDQRETKDRKKGLTLNGGSALVQEGARNEGWLELEDGVFVQFQSAGTGDPPREYRTGDYWLIPARTETGNILWPPPAQPDAAKPHGVAHYYAPLAFASLKSGKWNMDSCRRILKPVFE
jgi:hypothetical protein